MNYKIIVLPAAPKEILEIKFWFSKKESGLDTKFLLELKENINLIKYNPLLFQTKYESFRAAVLKRFPYLIYFSTENDIVFIHAVLAAKQDQERNISKK